MVSRILPTLLACAFLVAPGLSAPLPSLAVVEPLPVEPIVLGTPVTMGRVVPVGAATFGAPAAKQVDGDISDWMGASTMLEGTSVFSRGEYIYQDYLFDDKGADDGNDAKRADLIAPATGLQPRAGRADALSQAAGTQFGLRDTDPTGGTLAPFAAKEAYGDAAYPAGAGGHADLVEVRIAADATTVFVLARFATMTDPSLPALLLLADTVDGGTHRAVPFDSGLATDQAEMAFLVTQDGVLAADLRTPAAPRAVPEARVALDAAGYTNALEIAIPRTLVARAAAPQAPSLRLAVAAGIQDSPGVLAHVATGAGLANVVNVAFRHEESAGVYMDKAQAFALLRGSIDPFFADVDLDWLVQGATQPVQPTPGYHARVFRSAASVSREQGEDGSFQHYGLYIPTSWDPQAATPATIWLHWAGGSTHTHAAWTPRIVKAFGEDRGNLLVSPSARGVRSYFVGLGHVDFLEAWDDVHANYNVDPDRTYASGYSMGGFASFLLGLLYPDRFAAMNPINGPVTQGLWFGLDDDGADASDQAGGDARAEITHRIIENGLNLPYVVDAAANDEFVPLSSQLRMTSSLAALGGQFRLYIHPGYEHYTQAITDEWGEAPRALDLHVRNANPARVVYKRVPMLEQAVDTVRSEGIPLHFDFPGAYWLGGMTVRSPDAGDPRNFALADVRSEGIPDDHILLPEAGAAAIGISTPYVMHGQRWSSPLLASGSGSVLPSAFHGNFVNVATVQLDAARMGLRATVHGAVTTDGPMTLRLAGPWSVAPIATDNGTSAMATFAAGVLSIALTTGDHDLQIG